MSWVRLYLKIVFSSPCFLSLHPTYTLSPIFTIGGMALVTGESVHLLQLTFVALSLCDEEINCSYYVYHKFTSLIEDKLHSIYSVENLLESIKHLAWSPTVKHAFLIRTCIIGAIPPHLPSVKLIA